MHDSVMVYLQNVPLKVSQDRVLKNFNESTNHHHSRQYVRTVGILLVARKTRRINEHKTLLCLSDRCRAIQERNVLWSLITQRNHISEKPIKKSREHCKGHV